MRSPLALLLTAAAALTAVPLTASAAPDPRCSWSAKTEPDTVNVAFPDTHASYWSHAYTAAPGTELVVHGTYAKARYFSFHVYQPTGVPVDAIYDAQIRPDRGSTNPFAGGRASGRHDYTVHVVFTAKPARPAPNTVYAGETAQAGVPNPGGLLMLRVYTPTDPTSPQGGVPLPRVDRVAQGAVVTEGGACSNDLPSTGGAGTTALNGTSLPNDAPVTTGTITWGRAYGNKAAGFFPNNQNAYLSAGIDRVYGPLVVVRTKAPRFPDTQSGVLPSAKDQLRYWSFCQNSLSTRVSSCAADSDTVVGKDGYLTLVISDPAQRPANAVRAKGVTWIPWGGTDEKGLILYRHMVPASSFPFAVQRVDQGEDPAAVMKAYYPSARYCTKAAFEAGGWNGCAEI